MKIKFASGFTLVEILIVIAVLGVLAASVVVAINPLEHIARAKDSERKTNVANLFKALQASLVLGGGTYPPAENDWMDDLVTAGELKNKPGSGYLPPSSCSAIGTEETAELQDGYCYKVNASRSKAIVYTGLESNKELEGCTGTCDTAYNVLSSENLQPQVLFGSTDLQPSTEGTIGEIYHTYDEDLVGHWPFDNGNPNDIIGSNNGVLQCSDAGCSLPQPTTDRGDNVAKAFAFASGIKDWIEISNLSSYFNGTNPWTISLWVYTDGYTTEGGSVYNSIAYWGRVDTGSPPGSGFYLTNTNKARLTRNNGTVQSATSTGGINGVWHHVVGIYNANVMDVYIDGDLASGSPLSTGSISGTSLFYLGRDSNNFIRLFDGKVDDLRLWNRALTPSEIADLYDS